MSFKNESGKEGWIIRDAIARKISNAIGIVLTAFVNKPETRLEDYIEIEPDGH